MASNYPTGLDSFTTGTLTGVVSGSDHGNKGDAINKIQAELGTDPSGASATVAARLGLAAVKPTGTSILHVDADAGNNSNDGLSWGTAKATLAGAHSAMPNGGCVLLNSSVGEYQLTSALDWGGFHVEGVARASGGTTSLALVRHKYNGDLFGFGAKGGFLRNLLLYEDDVTATRTGAAISGTSSASTGGFIACENVVISGADATHAWERDVVLDGSAWAVNGIRKCVFLNCEFFGCRTAGETIKITRGVHCKFVGGFVDPSPTAVTQGIKLLDTGTTDAQFVNMEVIGDFSTEAAGGRCAFTGGITGTITCAASSAGNAFFVAGTSSTPVWTNTAGNDTNTLQGPTKFASFNAAATIAIPGAAEVVLLNGTTGPITSITATGMAGRRVTLIFSNAAPPSVTDGSNLILAGNFTATQFDTISLVSDGTNWYETARSVN